MRPSIEEVGPGAMSREQLRVLIAGDRPILMDFIDLESQLQPNGFDVTLREVSRFRGAGTIGQYTEDRVLPELEALSFGEDGWIRLPPGAYHILYNEAIDIPPSLMALGRPRSSLGRSGVTIHTAVWDAGYRGRSTSLLAVLNPEGFRVQRNARVMQLVFFGLTIPSTTGYTGQYLNENLGETRQGPAQDR